MTGPETRVLHGYSSLGNQHTKPEDGKEGNPILLDFIVITIVLKFSYSIIVTCKYSYFLETFKSIWPTPLLKLFYFEVILSSFFFEMPIKNDDKICYTKREFSFQLHATFFPPYDTN